MKKLLFTLAILSGAAFGSFAQTTTSAAATPANSGGRFSFGVDVAVPTGDVSDVYNFGIGTSVRYDAPLSPGVFFVVSGGYEAFLVKKEWTNLGLPSSDSYVPLKGGFKFYFGGSGLYGEALAGASIYTGEGGYTSFVYSPAMGYTFAGGFEASVRYEAWVKDGTFGQVAARLAFRFK